MITGIHEISHRRFTAGRPSLRTRRCSGQRHKGGEPAACLARRRTPEPGIQAQRPRRDPPPVLDRCAVPGSVKKRRKPCKKNPTVVDGLPGFPGMQNGRSQESRDTAARSHQAVPPWDGCPGKSGRIRPSHSVRRMPRTRLVRIRPFRGTVAPTHREVTSGKAVRCEFAEKKNPEGEACRVRAPNVTIDDP